MGGQRVGIGNQKAVDAGDMGGNRKKARGTLQRERAAAAIQRGVDEAVVMGEGQTRYDTAPGRGRARVSSRNIIGGRACSLHAQDKTKDKPAARNTDVGGTEQEMAKKNKGAHAKKDKGSKQRRARQSRRSRNNRQKGEGVVRFEGIRNAMYATMEIERKKKRDGRNVDWVSVWL